MPMDPTLGRIPTRLPIITVVSLWPKPSMRLSPVAFWNWWNTSGFRASPAMVACCTLLRSYWLRSCLMSIRYMVGGAQKVVMRYLANMGRMSEASKRSKS